MAEISSLCVSQALPTTNVMRPFRTLAWETLLVDGLLNQHALQEAPPSHHLHAICRKAAFEWVYEGL